ncbi:transposase [Streptomyces olivoreticuli]
MPARKKYSAELQQHAVRMVHDERRRNGTSYGSVSKVAEELGVGRETLRGWMRQAEIDSGIRPGRSTEDARRIAELEKELAELKRANRILLEAGGFIARELGPRSDR